MNPFPKKNKRFSFLFQKNLHFTLPVEERYPLFGVLAGERAETAFVRLNPFGHRVCQMLCGLAQFYGGKGFALKVLAQKVMPDHVHLVIQVQEPTEQTFLDAGIQAAVEETLRRKAEARHYAYTPIPVTSQRYRFVALNEMAKRLAF